MRPLREWIQEELDNGLQGQAAADVLGVKSRYWIGYEKAMDAVLKELESHGKPGVMT